MLVNKDYNVLVTNRNISRFREKYGDLERNETHLINVNDLSIGSHLKVDIICDICREEFNRPYKSYLKYLELYNYDTCNKCKYDKVKKTNLEKYGVENPFQSEEIKDKIKKTWIDNYGVDNPAKSNDIQDKIKNTNKSKYGSEYGLSNEEVRRKISDTKSKMGIQRPTDEIEEYTIYRNKVNNLTKINKKELLENWDGIDYYDGEYIKGNFELDSKDKNYPTIDHKKSILKSFLDGDSEEICASIDNLCITKRSINSSKCFKTEEEYLKD